MYLWDTNIVRHYGDGHHNLQLHLEQIPWAEIALPSVVVAEILRGTCDFALKATPSKAPFAHRLLLETRQFLSRFNIVVFDERCALSMIELKQKHKTHKRHADMMIAAIAKAGNHIVVTRNEKDFNKLLPGNQLVNWIDKKPT